MNGIDLGTIFLVAFLGSIGHCIGMCGGFIMAYSAAKIDREWNKTHQSIAHFLYNIGRVVAYMIIGAVFGLLGKVFSFSMASKGVLFLFIGILMVLMGLSLIGKLKFITYIESSGANSGLFRTLFRKLITSRSLPSFFFLGMLNGFIPCGFVYFFAAFAAATASPFWGAVVMLVFGMATVPVLFTLGFFSGLMQKMRFRELAVKIAGALVILYGLYTGYKGYMLIAHPETIKMKMIHMKQELGEELKERHGA
jgi:sulfite exporter TauE/SafE